LYFTISLRVFVVPENIAAKAGGTKPKNTGDMTLLEYYVPSGSSVKVRYEGDISPLLINQDGWPWMRPMALSFQAYFSTFCTK
jgi:hypothetical protein